MYKAYKNLKSVFTQEVNPSRRHLSSQGRTEESKEKLGVCTLLKAENWNQINWKPIEL